MGQCKIHCAYLAHDCGCWNADADLLCWPCYRHGFWSPNPEESANGGQGDKEPKPDTPNRSDVTDFGHGESTGVQDL